MTRDPQHLRQARESALQMLYGWEMSGDALPEAIAGVRDLQLRPPVAERDALAVSLAQGTARMLDRIDPLIAEAATNWRLERLAVIDRLVLRLAVYELLERPDVPPPSSSTRRSNSRAPSADPTPCASSTACSTPSASGSNRNESTELREPAAWQRRLPRADPSGRL